MENPSDPSVKPPVSPAVPPPSGGRALLLVALAVIVTLAVLGILTWISHQRDRAALDRASAADTIPTVSVIHPQPSAAQVELDLPGDLTAYEETPIYSRVSGYLKAWSTDIGTRVTNGQVLAEIETPELDQELAQATAALAQAQANLEIARISAERWQTLRQSDSVSQQDTDTRVATWHAQQANVQAAAANVQRLKEMTNFKTLVAPFAGIITVRTMDVGTLITAGSSREIFRLARVDPLRVYVSLPQAYSQMVQTNDRAVLTLTELPGQTFTGVVDRTAGAIDPISRTLLTEILVANPANKLLPGAHATVNIQLSNPEKPVVVPVNTLLFRDDQGTEAGVVNADGTVRLAKVTIGRDFGTTVEIVHGLSATDNVILNPSDSLEPDTQVRIAPDHTDTQPAHE